MMDLPNISPRQVVYEDRNRQIYEVTADFGGFTKQYLVSDSGQRAGLLVVRSQSVLLVRQFRLLINEVSWEIPGGQIDEGETPEAAATRECLEETGVMCQDLKPLMFFHPGMDTTNNPTHIFYTENCVEQAGPEPNAREVLERTWVPVNRCVDMIFGKHIVDSLTIVGILAYLTRNGRT